MFSFDFQRTNDNSFRFVNLHEEEKQEFFLNFTSTFTQKSYAISEQIAQYVLKNRSILKNKQMYFRIDGKIYKVHAKGLKKSERIAQAIASYFKYFNNSSKVELNVVEDYWAGKIKKSRDVIELHSCQLDDFPQAPFPENPIQILPFTDGFTKLATEACQKYEPHFASHDAQLQNSDQSQFYIVHRNQSLVLVPKNLYSPEEKGHTLQCYKEFLVKLYGKEKVDYIAHLYRINLEAEGPLTTEIVYRMNIGMGNIEKQDLDRVLLKLDQIAERISSNGFFQEEWMQSLTLHEMNGLKKLSAQKDEVMTWFQNYAKQKKNEKYQTALAIYSLDTEAQERQYTGRKIYYPIKSSYTIADKKFYKPWIDQQELLQVFAHIKNANNLNWDAYYELLAHIVSKKHLARRHPEESFRVGAIIPAPPEKNGQMRWYVVSSCISNGKGIHGYILEPLDSTDESLPMINLLRSTARGAYALDNLSSIRNDLNPINSPGYEGAEFIKKYQDAFIKDRTVPLWVAYYLQASKLVGTSRNEAKKTFFNAIRAYKQNKESHCKSKEMKKIVHSCDAELLELAVTLMKKSIFNFFKVCRLTATMLRYKKFKVSQKTQRKDLEFLLHLLKDEHQKFQKLKIALQNSQSLCSSLIEKKRKADKVVKKLLAMYKEDRLEQLQETLRQLACEENEQPHQKIRQSIIFTGHSLGGACAQKFFVDYSANSGRVPLEGLEMGIRSFDPPGINQEDNEVYKRYGIHKKLFKDSNLKFSIVHRFEAGDFVSQGGSEHLGASRNFLEQQRLQEWTSFETSVSKGLSSSTLPEIRDSRTAHSTLFEKGKRHPAFLIDSATTLLKTDNLSEKTRQRLSKIVKDRIGDYERTWVDPQILWRFNHGDKRTWKHIQMFWQEPGFLSTSIEAIRSFLGMIMRIFLYRISLNRTVEEQADTGHGDWWKFRDVNGVFTVDVQRGVLSCEHEVI